MKKILIAMLGILSIISLTLYTTTHYKQQNPEPKKKNTVMIIPDGMGISPITLVRELSEKKKLSFDDHFKALVKTRSLNSLVTESGAAGTALSCGIQTENGKIAMTKDDVPCKTIMEAAKEKGFKIGIVSGPILGSPTPASFTSHVPNRNQVHEIVSQQITKKVDVLLGGGLDDFLPKEEGGKREDGRNIVNEAQRIHGYNFVKTAKELSSANSLPLLGIFNNWHLPWEIDRNEQTTSPKLSEMTKKATELLRDACEKDRSCPGYFLLIVSVPEQALDANDPGTMVGEVNEVDNTFKYIASVAERFKDTLVVAVADHDAGGLTLGKPDQNMRNAWFPEILKGQKISGLHLSLALRGGADIKEMYKNVLGIDDLTEEEIEYIKEVLSRPNPIYGLVKPLNDRAGISYANHVASGADIPLFSLGPTSDQFRGILKNTEIVGKVAYYMGLEGIGLPLLMKRK